VKHSPAIASRLIAAACELRDAVDALPFAPPVAFVYNPLSYAWQMHEAYLKEFGAGRKRVVFLGMNPGPFGMAQTGVPFGEVSAVRDWMKLDAPVKKPAREHPKRPVLGVRCPRSEISGQRLWGLFKQRFGAAENFFADHFVANYCPLAFMSASGANLTPDKLPSSEAGPLFAACDAHLCAVVDALQPEWLIGIGDFAEKRLWQIFAEDRFQIGKVLHPSPASPAANRDWAGAATKQLIALGVW
jgi:single-strand selective monofunctional uracil DNA glycosylase